MTESECYGRIMRVFYVIGWRQKRLSLINLCYFYLKTNKVVDSFGDGIVFISFGVDAFFIRLTILSF